MVANRTSVKWAPSLRIGYLIENLWILPWRRLIMLCLKHLYRTLVTSAVNNVWGGMKALTPLYVHYIVSGTRCWEKCEHHAPSRSATQSTTWLVIRRGYEQQHSWRSWIKLCASGPFQTTRRRTSTFLNDVHIYMRNVFASGAGDFLHLVSYTFIQYTTQGGNRSGSPKTQLLPEYMESVMLLHNRYQLPKWGSSIEIL